MMATATSRPTAPSPYGYDAENRIVSATGPGITASYAYDAQGSRKSKTVNGATTMFVTDADNREVLEYDGSSGAVLRWYAYGLGPNDVFNQMNVAAATRATFVPDVQGSIIATLDSGTGTLSKRGYLPYGAGTAVTGTFAYTASASTPRPAASTTTAPECTRLHGADSRNRTRLGMPVAAIFMRMSGTIP